MTPATLTQRPMPATTGERQDGRISPEASAAVDFDVNGLVGIRLLNPAPADVAAVRRQLGSSEIGLTREPDITLRFLPRIDLPGNLRLLGLGETGYDEERFWLLRGKGKKPVKVSIPFEDVGRRCEVLCESGLPAVPLLVAMINLTALARGALPLHASAFAYQGKHLLVTGWAKGGKTETLLGFASRGAKYIGDEWVYLDGARMSGLPEPMRLWDWHLEDLPAIRRRLGSRRRMRLWSLKQLMRAAGFVGASRLGRWLCGSIPGRLARLLKGQLHVDVSPACLFGNRLHPREAPPPGVVLFVNTHASADVVVRPISPEEVARRMVFSLQDEQEVLRAHYRAFRFAFPGRSNELMLHSETLQRELLLQFLSGKKCFAVSHPYPAPIPALVEAIEPLLEAEAPRCSL